MPANPAIGRLVHISEAVEGVVLHQADSLHEGIGDGRTQKRAAAPDQVFAEQGFRVSGTQVKAQGLVEGIRGGELGANRIVADVANDDFLLNQAALGVIEVKLDFKLVAGGYGASAGEHEFHPVGRQVFYRHRALALGLAVHIMNIGAGQMGSFAKAFAFFENRGGDVAAGAGQLEAQRRFELPKSRDIQGFGALAFGTAENGRVAVGDVDGFSHGAALAGC
jgi:hypothetical protein